MAKAKLGRPTSMTEDTLAKLKEAFLMGCTDTEACLFANDISPATLYKYQEENPKFSEHKAQWKQNPIVEARTSVLKGMKRNPQLALSFLERKLKGEFSLRQELVGKDGEAIEVKYNNLKDDELDATIRQKAIEAGVDRTS